MYPSAVAIFFCCFCLQRLPGVTCAGDLGTVEYVAIGVSLGLTIFIVTFIVYFLWRARNRSSMDMTKEMGKDNPAATTDITNSAEGITRAPLPPPSQEQNKAQNTAQWVTYC